MSVSAPTLPWYHHPDRNCAGMDADDVSVSTCGGCPVVFECLESAMREEGADGACYRWLVRGGLEPDQRARLAVKQGRLKLYGNAAVNGAAPDQQSGECLDCGDTMMSQRRWRAASVKRRGEWAAQGLRCYGSRGRCNRCAKQHERVNMSPERRADYMERKRQAQKRHRAARKAREAA